MLSLFPSLLSWNQISPFLIRITLGGVFLYQSYRLLKKSSGTSEQKSIPIIEAIAGIFLIIGLWTQAAALVIIVDMLVRLYDKVSKKAFLTDGVNYYLLLLIMALSLMFMGAGMLSFDYPL